MKQQIMLEDLDRAVTILDRENTPKEYEEAMGILKTGKLDGLVKILDRENTADEYTKAIKALKQVVKELRLPIIVHPGGWGEDILTTENNARVHAERLKMLAAEDGKITEATDFEAILYISTASLVAPLDHDFYKIMMHLFSKCYPEHVGIFEGENTELDSYLNSRMHDFKQWLRRQQLKGGKA